MKLNKVTEKVALNVSAQGCKNDCTYWKTYSARGYRALGHYSHCRKVTDARWCKWW